MTNKKRKAAKELALKYLGEGDPVGWFEDLYTQAGEDASVVPWADMAPNPHLVTWMDKNPLSVQTNALMIGSGLGDDAEELAKRGFKTTAFDISPAAIEWSRKRFPDSSVSYEVADLFDAPPHWSAAYDFVVETYTVQALPPALRTRAMRCIASFVAPGGMLLVITRGCEPDDPKEELPWPLTKKELSSFEQYRLTNLSLEDYYDNEDPPKRRFRTTYQKRR